VPGGSHYILKFILEDEGAIGPVVSTMSTLGAGILSLQKNEPTLEDVFVKLVGRSLTDEGEAENG
jgi:ABC-2 type transport system ATP-binding protein